MGRSPAPRLGQGHWEAVPASCLGAAWVDKQRGSWDGAGEGKDSFSDLHWPLVSVAQGLGLWGDTGRQGLCPWGASVREEHGPRPWELWV